MKYHSSSLWVWPPIMWCMNLPLSGPAGRLLGSGKQLNTQAEPIHCSEPHWSVTAAEGGARCPPPYHLLSTARRRVHLAAEQMQSEERSGSAGSRLVPSDLGAEETGGKRDKEPKAPGRTDGVYTIWFGTEPDSPVRIEGDILQGSSVSATKSLVFCKSCSQTCNELRTSSGHPLDILWRGCMCPSESFGTFCRLYPPGLLVWSLQKTLEKENSLDILRRSCLKTAWIWPVEDYFSVQPPTLSG